MFHAVSNGTVGVPHRAEYGAPNGRAPHNICIRFFTAVYTCQILTYVTDREDR